YCVSVPVYLGWVLLCPCLVTIYSTHYKCVFIPPGLFKFHLFFLEFVKTFVCNTMPRGSGNMAERSKEITTLLHESMSHHMALLTCKFPLTSLYNNLLPFKRTSFFVLLHCCLYISTDPFNLVLSTLFHFLVPVH
uniref:Uncharacterized protein n=1 Tax=Crocodylus porosus TaxID=8502 RepID=A0A7M4FBW9_CROPO